MNNTDKFFSQADDGKYFLKVKIQNTNIKRDSINSIII